MHITRYRQAILIALASLDALLFVRFMHQIAWPSYLFHGSHPLWVIVLEICRPLFLVSLAFSAFGLVRARKWAFILSYIQYPFRFVFVLLSFGFMAALAKIPHFPATHMALMITVIVLECFRLALTIAIHRTPDHRAGTGTASAPVRRHVNTKLPPIRRFARIVWWPTFLGMCATCYVIVMSDDHIGPLGYQPVWPILLILNGVIGFHALLICPGLHMVQWMEHRKVRNSTKKR